MYSSPKFSTPGMSRSLRQRLYCPSLDAVIFLLAVFLLPVVHAAVADDLTQGKRIAQMVYDRPTGEDAASAVMMLLYSKSGRLKQRILYSYAKDRGNSERWTLLRFVEPKDVAGTGLLTLDYKGDESDQWLYLPALDRVRRISSSRKGGRFVGSDFYYEDLLDREVDMDTHKLLGKALLGKIECYLLESIPTDPDNSVYNRRLSWIHPKLMLPLRIDYYQGREEKPVKRLQASKIKKIQGYWTVFESTMSNLKKGTKTRLITKTIKYDQNLPDDLFNQRGLADKTRELPFRP